jgi:hypothetical protein
MFAAFAGVETNCMGGNAYTTAKNLLRIKPPDAWVRLILLRL